MDAPSAVRLDDGPWTSGSITLSPYADLEAALA